MVSSKVSGTLGPFQLSDALVRNPVASLGWNGPTVPLTLEDATVLAWLRNNLGGVLTVAGGPPADPRRRR